MRYKQLLFLAQKCPPMDEALKVEDNKVPGCLSTVHVHASFDSSTGTLSYTGDSDGLLTKGLVAMLVEGLSGCTPEEIQTIDPSFISRSGIDQSLTPGRNNGFLNMIQVMKNQALTAGGHPAVPAVDEGNEEGDSGKGPIYNQMVAKLRMLQPTEIDLEDESHKHANHAGAKGFDGESHFKLYIVAPAFDGLNSLKRHRLIYTILGDVMDRIHALEIVSKSPSEV